MKLPEIFTNGYLLLVVGIPALTVVGCITMITISIKYADTPIDRRPLSAMMEHQIEHEDNNQSEATDTEEE